MSENILRQSLTLAGGWARTWPPLLEGPAVVATPILGAPANDPPVRQMPRSEAWLLERVRQALCIKEIRIRLRSRLAADPPKFETETKEGQDDVWRGATVARVRGILRGAPHGGSRLSSGVRRGGSQGKLVDSSPNIVEGAERTQFVKLNRSARGKA